MLTDARPRTPAPGLRVGLVPFVLALTLVGTAPMLVAPAPACAASTDSAALVVDTGGRATRYCVEMDAAGVSGIELIELAGEQYGLDYRLGYGGAGVCRLDHVGIGGGECFTASDEFWGYWRGTGAGWSWSSTGAAGTVVEPGDVEGWSWGAGRDGSTHRAPPATSYASACGDSPPSPHPPGGGGGGQGNGHPSAGTGGDEGGAATLPGTGAADAPEPGAAGEGSGQGGGTDPPDRNGGSPSGGDARPPSSQPSTSSGSSSDASNEPSPVDATPLAAAPLDRTGPPIGALASAGGAIVLLLAAGWISLRRRPGG